MLGTKSSIVNARDPAVRCILSFSFAPGLPPLDFSRQFSKENGHRRIRQFAVTGKMLDPKETGDPVQTLWILTA
jgi:hypothetical protein